MLRVAISGNIASGKSTIQDMLVKKGYKVLDTDDVSKNILSINNKPLFEAFKNYDVFEDGEFSRHKVAELIFSNEEARKLIASIMHPQIAEEIKRFFEDNKEDEILFVGIPLLFEAKMQSLFDKIIFVYTDDNIRLKRLLKRNNYSIEHAVARIKSQMSQEEKIKFCDYVIDNCGSIEVLRENLEKILSNIAV